MRWPWHGGRTDGFQKEKTDEKTDFEHVVVRRRNVRGEYEREVHPAVDGGHGVFDGEEAVGGSRVLLRAVDCGAKLDGFDREAIARQISDGAV